MEPNSKDKILETRRPLRVVGHVTQLHGKTPGNHTENRGSLRTQSHSSMAKPGDYTAAEEQHQTNWWPQSLWKEQKREGLLAIAVRA